MTDLDQATTTEVDERAAYTAGLRHLADILDANPKLDLPVNYGGLGVQWVNVSKATLVEFARAIPGRKDKDINGSWITLVARLDGLVLTAFSGRDEVCERIVIGTETVTEEIVDPAAPKVTVTREVEQVEWRCHPILDGEPVAS